MKTNSSFLARSIVILALTFAVSARAGSFADRRESAVNESGKPQAVAGAEKFSVALPYEKAFELIVTTLQKADYDISDANKDGGMIATAISIVGGFKQTGTRAVLTLIRDGEASTLIKVAVTEQKRYKALQVEPWSTAKLNSDKTAALVALLKGSLAAK